MWLRVRVFVCRIAPAASTICIRVYACASGGISPFASVFRVRRHPIATFWLRLSRRLRRLPHICILTRRRRRRRQRLAHDERRDVARWLCTIFASSAAVTVAAATIKLAGFNLFIQAPQPATRHVFVRECLCVCVASLRLH